jgi:hypothetical protein
MPRMVHCGLIQARCEWSPDRTSLSEIKKKMIAKHERIQRPEVLILPRE